MVGGLSGIPSFSGCSAHQGWRSSCSSRQGGHWAEQGHPPGVPALPSPVPIPWRVDDGGTCMTSEKLPSAWGGSCGGGSLPGVDAILPAEGVLDGEAPVVELQGGEAALVQAHHLTMAQGGCLGAVPCGTGCSASHRPSLGSTACCGPGPHAGGPGNSPGRVVPAPALERQQPGDGREVPVPGQWTCQACSPWLTP